MAIHVPKLLTLKAKSTKEQWQIKIKSVAPMWNICEMLLILPHTRLPPLPSLFVRLRDFSVKMLT